MKATKKLFALVLALVMAMALSVTAFAYDYGDGDGSITITNATVEESYSIYKIFDTDSTGSGSITATTEQKSFYEDQNDNPFNFTSNSAGTYNVTIKDGVSDAQVIAFLRSFVTTNEGTITVDSSFARVTTTYGPQTAESATVVFNEIPYGYYLVTSSLGTVVTVNSTDPDVEVIDKNQDGGSSFTKTVGSDNKVVEIGEEFDYTLSFTATNYDGETEIAEYTINDVLGTGLALVYEENDTTYGVSVKVGGGDAQNVTVTYENNILTITIPWIETDMESEDYGAFLYTSPVDVTVTYTAVLTDSAAIQDDITNSATLTWTENNTGTSTTETVQTYALAIMKVDEEGNALEGATFTVTRAVADDEEITYVPVYVSQVCDENGEPIEGVYVVDPDGTSNVVVSPESGLIVIKGVDNVEYTLTETAAPAGYNLLDGSFTVTPAATGSTAITIYYDADGNVVDTSVDGVSSGTVIAPVSVTAKVVVNESGSLLPSTGGMGTTVIYIVGALLVIGAGIVLVVRRRMSAE